MALGVQTKKKIKRHSKKRFFKKLIDYLKSDTYMYASLFCSQPSDFPSTKMVSASDPGVDQATRPIKENGKKLLKKIGDYLKSDCYMYAPIVQPSHSVDTKKVIAPRTVLHLQRRGVTASISTRKIVKKIDQPIEEIASVIEEDPLDGRPLEKSTVVKQTIAHLKTVKHMVHQHCRSTSKQAKGMLEKSEGKFVSNEPASY